MRLTSRLGLLVDAVTDTDIGVGHVVPYDVGHRSADPQELRHTQTMDMSGK
jgi:hypothetical protein